MYTTTRRFFPNGIEGEEMDCTILEHESYEKALNYCHRYSKGLRFAGVIIEDENGNEVYELLDNGEEIFYQDNIDERIR
jgi:predicted transcriptional regulator